MAFTLRATVATMLNIMFHYLSKLLITLFLLVPINLDHQWLCNIELHFLLTSNFLDYVYASNVQSIYIVSKPWYVEFKRKTVWLNPYNEWYVFLKCMKFCSISYFTFLLDKNKDIILYMHDKISSNMRSLFSRKIHNQFSVKKKYRGFM